MPKTVIITLNRRRQTLTEDSRHRLVWKVVNERLKVPASELAIGICDMWDDHWAKGAAQRVNEMAPRMNKVISAARDKGVTIIHEPSDTMEFYKNSPARGRVKYAPAVEPPPEIAHDAPPKPVDDTGDVSDTPALDGLSEIVWTRQHKAIKIDDERDGISDDGREVWNFMQARGIKHYVIMGVHTGMCILDRKFAIKQMVKWGMDVMLCQDMTDALYSPAKPPYVSQQEGTQLIIGYIEKFWCPTIESRDLMK